MTQTKTTREYIDIENDLRIALNSRGKKGYNKAEKVLYLLKELRTFKEGLGIMNFQISKQFLKGLYEKKTTKQRNDNLSYLLKDIQKEVIKKNKYFKEIIFKKFKTTATAFKNYVYSSKNNYIKSFRVGKIYTAKKQKAYDFLVLDSEKIKQIQEDKKALFRKSLNLFPDFTLKYFFNLTQTA